jgi:hypothetical protein
LFNPNNRFGSVTEGGLAEAGLRLFGEITGGGIAFEPNDLGWR